MNSFLDMPAMSASVFGGAPDPDAQLSAYRDRIEAALERALPPPDPDSPDMLPEAMRYAALGGGKRLRALLVYATGAAFDARPEVLDAPACAIELIHAYSLVHDDLPAMDDDEFRRGKPSCHIAFDEATAILAGDALQTLAFDLLAGDHMHGVPAQQCLEMVAELARAAGYRGMAGGQALDLALAGRVLASTEVERVHRAKTGALIRAAVTLGALAAGVTNESLRRPLDDYAACAGLAFQIVDDLLDHGDDAVPAAGVSFTAALGPERAHAQAEALYREALENLAPLGDNAFLLRHLADRMIHRHT
jgi:geranylgeranyl pyrophosphate synthase